MESEKVKEIKEKLQEEIFIANRDKLRKVPTKELKNLLTLINELESENEILRNAKVVHETVDYCYEDLKKAEKRIAELEKENGELKVDLKNSIDMQKQMLDGFKTATKEVEENLAREIPNLLKQFADRLKEKFPKNDFITFSTNSHINKEIDQTLKEFINE